MNYYSISYLITPQVVDEFVTREFNLHYGFITGGLPVYSIILDEQQATVLKLKFPTLKLNPYNENV